MIQEQLLSFSPDERLVIAFSDHTTAATKLHITNIGRSSYAFKIKTTTPDRYLVKPNHGLIHQDAIAEISIVVVQTKKKDIVTKAKSHNAIKCTDKFLIQSSIVDQLVVCELENKTSSELAEAITRLFSKREKKLLNAKKLLVDFTYTELNGENRYQFDKEVAKESIKKMSLDTTAPASVPGTPEAMFAEIVALRKKYDDLVAFTVKLTAERDSLSSDLYIAKSKLDDGHYSTAHSSNSNHKHTDSVKKGTRASSAVQLILIIIFSFLMGHMTQKLVDNNWQDRKVRVHQTPS